MASEQQVVDAFSLRDKERAVALLSTVRVHPSTIRGKYNRTLLHLASYNNWPDVCKLLVDKYQLDPHCRDSDGYTALHYACIENNHEVVRYLVQYCCSDPLVENNRGFTPLNKSSGETRKFLQEIIDTSEKQGFEHVTKYLEHQKLLEEAKKHGFKDITKYLEFQKATKKAEAILDEAMSEGSGELSQCNILFHGAPGAGKSSVKCLILGQPRRPKHKQNATDIMENSVRTVCVSRVAAATSSNQHFTEVDNDDLISRIAVEAEKHRSNTENGKQKRIVNRPNLYIQDTLSVDIKETTQTLLVSQPSADLQHAEDGESIANEATNTEEIIKERLIKIQLSSSGNASVECVFDSRWLHHIDSGGQPQFLDVFPLLYNSPSHCVVVMRLTEGLDTRPKVRFYCKGKDEYCLPDQLVLSNREMILRTCQIAQSIAEATNGKFIPRVFIVGTHLDKVGFFQGTRLKCIKKIDKQLAQIYKQYKKVMVCKSADEYIFPVNTMAKGMERQQYTEEFQRRILSATKKMSTPVTVPLNWMIFHLEIDKADQGVIRMPDCIKVGEKLKMTKEKVRVALQFLNGSALILYYPNDVPDLVLTKMDPFTNRLSRLIKASFILPDDELAEECDELREKGIFRKSFLRRVFPDLDENLLSDEEFLKLLVRLKIAVNIDGDLYFLPSALSLERPTESSFKCQSNPLALLWNELILPHGFFLTVSVEMQDKSGREGGYVFDLRRDIAQWRGEIQLSESKKSIPGVVKLTDRQRWIQVSYSGDKSYCSTVYGVVTSATQRAIERLKHTGIGSPTIGCVCPLCPEKEEDHFCYLSEDRRFMTCSTNESKTGPVTENISCWLEGDSQSTNDIPEVTSSPDNENYPVEPSKGKSDDEQEKDISPIAVLIRHTPELSGVVSDVDSLVADLTLAGIISESDITSSTGDRDSRYQKIKAIMDTFQSCLVKSSNPKEMLVKFSNVLKNQNNETLRRISVDINRQLILSQTPKPLDVFNLVKDKAYRWDDIGRELEVPFGYRESLRIGIQSYPESKLESVLQKWVESKCSEVSWRQAIRVLTVLQFDDVIESTRQFLRREDILNKYLPMN